MSRVGPHAHRRPHEGVGIARQRQPSPPPSPTELSVLAISSEPLTTLRLTRRQRWLLRCRPTRRRPVVVLLRARAAVPVP